MSLSSRRLHSSGSASDEEPPVKRARKQVSRACDWCRARRIRCDNGQPCKACLKRGAECTREGVGPDEPRTLPQALREVDRLKARVRELEIEALELRTSPQTHLYKYQTSAIPTPGQSSEGSISAAPDHIATAPYQRKASKSAATASLASVLSRRPHWEGIYLATARSNQRSYYGPSSIFYFVSRIGGYLAKSLRQPFADRSMQPRGASRNMHLGTAADEPTDQTPALDVAGRGASLSRTQEEAFLRLFWEGYHCILPIIDETEFRKHYASLWEPARNRRKHCALVDIVLALCLQYSYAFIPRSAGASEVSASSTGDATLAGRWYFRRSQSLITADLESPSIHTIQCYVLMAVYLCCASFHNMCHMLIGQAIRAAQVVGLHLEPPSNLPSGERELRKRVWWMLWALDARISAKLGRPFLVDWAQVTVTQPADDPDAAAYNGAVLASQDSQVTWLSYSLHLQKLLIAMVDIYDALFVSFGEVMQRKDIQCPYHDPEALESCAVKLAGRLPALTRSWREGVPAGLKTSRRGGGEPMSTDRSLADLDDIVPSWLQLQRLCLELMYHNVIINLTRPFIPFYTDANTYTPMAERLATTCAEHAVAFTLLMHQAVTETDIMGGWTEYFSLQWNASVTLVGFGLAYPLHPAATRVRQAVDKAIAVFDSFGKNFDVSADAAAITRDLTSKMDRLAGQLVGETRGDDLSTGSVLASTDICVEGNELAWLDPSQQSDPTQFSQFMDWAMSVDSYNNYDDLFNVGDGMDLWASGN